MITRSICQGQEHYYYCYRHVAVLATLCAAVYTTYGTNNFWTVHPKALGEYARTKAEITSTNHIDPPSTCLRFAVAAKAVFGGTIEWYISCSRTLYIQTIFTLTVSNWFTLAPSSIQQPISETSSLEPKPFLLGPWQGPVFAVIRGNNTAAAASDTVAQFVSAVSVCRCFWPRGGVRLDLQHLLSREAARP